MSSATWLSQTDTAVLDAIFDPEASTSSAFESPNIAQVDEESAEDRSLTETEREALLPLNCEDPAHDEILATIHRLDSIIEAHPTRASAWNNRAQARRMLFHVNDLDQHLDDLQLIFDDLAKAIWLAESAAPVSARESKVLAAAHTHRGYLLLSASRLDDQVMTTVSKICGVQMSGPNMLEEAASRDFAVGAKYGSEVARQMAVKTNPYAKMCGNIVREALQKEIADHYQTSAGGLY